MLYTMFDANSIADRFGGLQLVEEVAAIYLSEEPALVQRLVDAKSHPADLERLALQAHSLKGSLAMLGVNDLVQIAEELCNCVRTGEHHKIDMRYNALLDGLERLRLELMEFLGQD
jgi:HPt (histidine-containing phosphotransfer) domain-containing protein